MAFSVAWDAYQNNICNGLSLLQQKGKFVDMTIAADGHHVKAHQMVLSLVSPYIGELISSAACPHPVIFLNQVSIQTLQSILQYAYTGEVMVARDNISEFLAACKALHIRGVEDLGTSSKELESAISDLTGSATGKEDMPLTSQKRGGIQTPLHNKNDSANSDDDDDTMDSSYDHTPYHCGGSSPVNTNTTSSQDSKFDLKNISDNLQYTMSFQGNLQLVCNRYLYFLMSSRKSGERMWRCMTYKRKGTCRAFLVTKENRIIKRVGAHNHPFHDAQIMKRLNKGNLFSALKDVEQHVENMKNASSSNEPAGKTSVIINHAKNGGQKRN